MQDQITISKTALNEVVTEAVRHELAPFIESKNVDELVTRQDTARKLDISLPTLDKQTALGKIKAYRFGKLIRYKMSDIMGALEAIN